MNKKDGPPVDYSDEIALEICELVSICPKMLEELCEENKHWPAPQTIYKWRIKHAKFGEMYARAKQCQIEPLVSTIILKAREASKDFYHDEDGKKHINNAHISRLKIELDNIKWYASKLAPKIYGTSAVTFEAEGSLLEKFIDKL